MLLVLWQETPSCETKRQHLADIFPFVEPSPSPAPPLLFLTSLAVQGAQLPWGLSGFSAQEERTKDAARQMPVLKRQCLHVWNKAGLQEGPEVSLTPPSCWAAPEVQKRRNSRPSDHTGGRDRASEQAVELLLIFPET